MKIQMTLSKKAIAGVALLCCLAVSQSAAAGVRKEVRFERGTSGATIEGAVLRGERDRYLLGAGKGQYLQVKLQSAEDNAVLDIFAPGANDSDETDIRGTTLPGGKEVTEAVIQLPTSGKFLISIGGTRGNAQYKLSVTITSTPPAQVASRQQANTEAKIPPTTMQEKVRQGKIKQAQQNAQSPVNKEAAIIAEARKLSTNKMSLDRLKIFENVHLKVKGDQFGENLACDFDIDAMKLDGSKLPTSKYNILIRIEGGKLYLFTESFFGKPNPPRVFVNDDKKYLSTRFVSDQEAALLHDDTLRLMETANRVKVSHGQGASGEIAFIFDMTNAKSMLKIGQTLCSK